MPENPWEGVLEEAQQIRTPKAIFKEQALLLTQQFRPKLMGNLKVRRDSGGSVMMDLNAVAPMLQNYTVTLVTASHGAGLYPCEINSPWVENSSAMLFTPDALEKQLVLLLKTSELRRIVASMYAQAAG